MRNDQVDGRFNYFLRFAVNNSLQLNYFLHDLSILPVKKVCTCSTGINTLEKLSK